MRTTLVFAAAILLRLGLLYFGYTDVDYLVFTDAARYVARGRSPYERATYRYTPLLAWLLYPTTLGGLWFEYGKVLFSAADLLTGWLIIRILRRRLSQEKATSYACIWLLNPIVASISARGSSEGLVCLLTVALLWATLQRRFVLAGGLLGFAVHFKIYPFIYAASIFCWADPTHVGSVIGVTKDRDRPIWLEKALAVFNPARRKLTAVSALTFILFNAAMTKPYGLPFIEHTFLYHFTRIDHRHNFSVYNTLLHLNSASQDGTTGLRIESLAFIPQLLLSVVIIPPMLAKKNLPGAMLAQTFAFVTFNKVCTSQYFLWYMVFLPVYLPDASLLWSQRGLVMIGAWVAGQALWLQQGYELEFLGNSTFVPGLWLASINFFLLNCWALSVIVEDVGMSPVVRAAKKNDDPKLSQ
ncbi:GPI mannosyltransferase 1 [Friedmanniomyces endolithicus]|uniref:GPI mannosyltransferase 1 n=1 Tax=Friedmanniomyces endolithicus TaxID=329885 RepID=A0AAN6J2R6_9PEZI|nr:GPI mannosyltransferase 1 [Friedmanniomyces endolithicus]KAK0309567.1 GPI mannosyltransferase 1 [Friedmanniomyces endolithicus]KAK0835966.1 GPI mannosyltransferase 1 [Friedmanniomyces endolithicus]KAK0938471.1 GPI mannosyltransferase 1 [Friedmanniomyces endolithicus]KAK1052350.1 GPI mannosyltransferase 1 [Friedmanniomyces endolithicus]